MRSNCVDVQRRGGRRKSTFREWTRKQYTTLDCSPESLPIHSLTYLLDRSYTQRARATTLFLFLSLSLSRSAFSPIHFHIHTYTPLNSPPSTHRAVLARSLADRVVGDGGGSVSLFDSCQMEIH